MFSFDLPEHIFGGDSEIIKVAVKKFEVTISSSREMNRRLFTYARPNNDSNSCEAIYLKHD